MGFHPQPNDWSCGPVALEHALLTIGQMVDPDRLAKLADTDWWSGTDELGLARAAARYQCDLELVRARHPEKARSQLTSYLRAGCPVLLCVDDWGHWIAVLRRQNNSFVVVDSNDDPVLGITEWGPLQRRWRYLDYDYDEDDPPQLFDMYPLEPRARPAIKADLSIQRVRHLRRAENRDLAVHWNEYLDDLLSICRPPSNRVWSKLTMAELLRRHQALIISRVVYWHGDVEPRLLEHLFRNYRFIAETYGLIIPESSARQAVADLAVLATMWVIANRGAPEMYGVIPDS
jgi:hypothetical protein